MKKTLFITTLLLSAGAMFTSCNKDVENPDMQAQPEETAQERGPTATKHR